MCAKLSSRDGCRLRASGTGHGGACGSVDLPHGDLGEDDRTGVVRQVRPSARAFASLFVRRDVARATAIVAYDFVAWTVAVTFAVFERYDFRVSHIDVGRLATAAPAGAVLAIAASAVVGLYAGRWTVGSLDEVPALSASVVLGTIGLFAADSVWWANPLPRSSVIGAGFIALVLMGAGRLAWRTAGDRRLRPSDEASRMIVFGAGEAGMASVRAMLRQPSSPYLPVAFLDDALNQRNLRYMGVRVMGGRGDIARVATTVSADTMLIAIPSAGREVFLPLTQAAEAAGLDVKVLPPLTEFVGVDVQIDDIRDVQEEDILGRRVVHTDVESIAGYLTGKRVLVTGAGGSIGSELCRQISRFGPLELVKLDRDESALHAVELSIAGRALLDSPDLVVMDIRDGEGLRDLFTARRPQVVFHAAALKHMPLLERHPGEAVQTNVWGTRNVLEAAAAVGVEHFVNISTDKAADPISVLGYSKRITERLTAAYGDSNPGVWVSVRFGNVLGSRGSMLPTFRGQVAAGGPITVTDPQATRYFMLIREAVELVIQAGAIGRNGEALVLDMGDAVRIDDVARRVARFSRRKIDIVYTGLRDGEKLHETLLSVDEVGSRPFHPLISHVAVPPLRGGLDGISCRGPADEISDRLRALARAADGVQDVPLP